MDEAGSLGQGASAVRYFLHKCINDKCSRILYIVIDAENLCGACWKNTTAISRGIEEEDDSAD